MLKFDFNTIRTYFKFVIRIFVDFVGVFMPLPQVSKNQKTEINSIKRKKNILIFNWRDTKHKFAGGAEVYIHELAKRWVEKRHHVTLFCGNDGKSSRNEVIEGVQIVRRGGFYFVYLWAFLYYILRFKGRYDLIIDCENGIPFFTPLYVDEPVYFLIFHVHQEVFFLSLIKPAAQFAAFLEKKVMPWAYQNIPILTISKSSKKQIRNIGFHTNKIEIICPGVELEKLKPSEKYPSPLILYLGRLKPYKSVDVLIKAFTKVSKKIPYAKLVIAGDGESRHELKLLAKKLGIMNKIIFTGRISEERKIKLMQESWVLVNPSLMEGWGITTIEANACGTPVVASDVPGLRDSIKNPHTGLLVPYGNVNAFADKIVVLLKNEKIRNKMQRNCVEWASFFSWNNSVRKSIKILDI